MFDAHYTSGQMKMLHLTTVNILGIKKGELPSNSPFFIFIQV